MLLVALAGKARVGKDTIGQHLCAEYGFQRYYFAKPLKDMLGALGFPEIEYQTPEEKEAEIPELGRSYRHLAQTLGTEWGRYKVHNEIWVKLAERAWKALQDDVAYTREMGADYLVRACPGMVITDCRFGNEAGWVRQAGGVVIHVIGNGQFGMSDAARAHESEAGLPFYEGDKLLFNHYDRPTDETMRALRASVDALINGLLVERGMA
jgi:hypothetical protein